jgi:hypothetical protein
MLDIFSPPVAGSARRTVGFLTLGVGVLASIGSLALNAHYWSGRSPDQFGFAIAVVMAAGLDITKVVSAAYIGWAWKEASRSMFALLLVLLTLGLTANVVASIGFVASNRAQTSGAQVAKGQLYADARRALDDAKTSRAQINEVETSATLTVRIMSVIVNVPTRFREGTESCKSDADTRDCKLVRSLHERRTQAIERERLDGVIEKQSALVGSRVGDAGNADGDAQVIRLTQLTGLTPEKVELLLAILFAVFVEASSAGTVAVARALLATNAPTPDTTPDAESEDHILTDFFNDKLLPDPRARTSAEHILDELGAHCGSLGIFPPSPQALGRFLGSRGLTRIKSSGRIVYRGITLKNRRSS